MKETGSNDDTDLDDAEVVYLSVIVAGELLTGFKGAILLSFDTHFEAIDGLLLWHMIA